MVRNEARSRDRNEWIGDIRRVMGDEATTEVYVCECGDATCVDRVNLTGGVRSPYVDTSRVAIAVEHENPEIDSWVSEGSRFSVVTKIAGRPAWIPRQTAIDVQRWILHEEGLGLHRGWCRDRTRTSLQ